MISCDEAVSRLWEYLEDELTSKSKARIEEHLAFCRRCCGEVRFAGELHNILSDRTDVTLPEDVAGRLEGFVDGMETR